MYVVYKMNGGVTMFACEHGWSIAWGDAARYDHPAIAERIAHLLGAHVAGA